MATVFIREWRYLEGERREEIVAERRRYEERLRALFRDGREHGELRTDLDESAAALLVLSAANWAYTWLTPGRDTDALADSFAAILVDGIRGYSTPDRDDDPDRQPVREPGHARAGRARSRAALGAGGDGLHRAGRARGRARARRGDRRGRRLLRATAASTRS